MLSCLFIFAITLLMPLFDIAMPPLIFTHCFDDDAAFRCLFSFADVIYYCFIYLSASFDFFFIFILFDADIFAITLISLSSFS